MKVLLNCLPPCETRVPSAAMSILQAYLSKQDIKVETKYWNLLFANVLSDFKIGDKEVLQLLPFLSYIGLQHHNGLILNKLENKLRIGSPERININKTYYTELLLKLSNAIKQTFISELKRIYIKEYAVLGISAKFRQWIPGNILAELAKRMNPHIKIVIGGFGTKEEAIAMLRNFDIYDYAIWGEGEFALLGLCRYLENSAENQLSEVQHLVYRENNTLKTTKVKSEYLDLNNVNPDFSSYFNQSKTGLRPRVPIEGSRGCHWRKCKFCFLNSGYKNRCKDADRVVSFIKSTIEKYNVYDFNFLDNDLVNNDLRSFEKLLDLLIDLRQEYPAFSIHNAEIITKGFNSGIIKKMSFAGIKSVQIGYEAINDDILKKINKKNTLSSNILFIKWARIFNIKVSGANIITGLIGEIDTEILDSIKNLHFLRFYLEKNILQHKLAKLAITSASPYYKYIVDKHLKDRWNSHKLSDLLPKQYFNQNDRFDFFDYLRNTTNPLWEDLKKHEKYYLDNSYYYQIIKKDTSNVLYREFFNSLLINELEFDTSSLDWKVLCHSNHKVSSKQEIIESYTANSAEIENIIKELSDEYLLYTNNDLSEIISLINTDLIYH